MKIVILSGAGEPRYSSNKALTHAFRILGHEVIFIGPGYFNRYDADILLPDKPHIEYYSYNEVLSRLPWQPDLALCIDPHGFYKGPKPPELISALVATDAHRAGNLYYKVIKQGEYDVFFCSQKYFLPLFLDLPSKVYYLPVGFDERRFPSEDPYWQKEPECDIVFIGQTGLADMKYPYNDDVGKFATTTPDIWDHKKFAFGFHPGYDYAHRGELLYRLCREFNVRIYSDVWDTPNYFRALRKGAIGFNCSLLHDLSIRCLEVAASGRLLVTDEVEDITDGYVLSFNKAPYPWLYRLHYTPFFDNFSLSYKEVRKIIKYWLLHNEQREYLAALAKRNVWERHAWRHRAEDILQIVFN